MARPGPTRTPTTGMPRHGSWRAAPRPDAPPPGVAPVCPRWMDTESRRLWETVTGDLDEVGRLAHSDGNALAQYVAMLAQWQRLATFLHAHGETAAVRHTYHVPERCAADGERLPSHRVETSRQELRPEAKLALALADRLLRLEEQLGLRPTSRASISAALTAARKATSGHPLTLDPRRFWRLQA